MAMVNEDIKSEILGWEAPNFLLDKVTWITAKESGMIASKGLSSTLATQSIIATSETPALGVAKLAVATADGPSRISEKCKAYNTKCTKCQILQVKTSADRAVL